MRTSIENVVEKEIKGIWGEAPKSGQETTPVIKTNNMTYEGFIDYNGLTPRFIPSKKLASSYLRKGDLLIEKSGGTKYHSVGYINFFDGEDDKYVCNNFILALRPNKAKVRPKYLFYQLKYKYERGQFNDCYNKTTGIQNLQVQSYLSKPIVLPAFMSQDSAISDLDNIIAAIIAKKKQIADLDSLVKSRFIEMFDSSNKKPLEDLADIVMGQSPNSSSYNDNGVGTPFFQGKADYGDKYTNVAHWTISPTKMAKKGDVLMSVRAPVGPVNIASVDCCIGRGLCSIRAKTGVTNTEFLYNALKAMEEDIADKGNGSTFKAINKNDVHHLLIPEATIEMQKEFSRFSSQVDKSEFVVRKQIKDLQELLDAKMDEYFGGDEE